MQPSSILCPPPLPVGGFLWFRISCPPRSAALASLPPFLLLPQHGPKLAIHSPSLLFLYHPLRPLQETRALSFYLLASLFPPEFLNRAASPVLLGDVESTFYPGFGRRCLNSRASFNRGRMTSTGFQPPHERRQSPRAQRGR